MVKNIITSIMLPPVTIHLTKQSRIKKGAFWQALTIFWRGDVTSWQLFGQIRIKPNNKLLADFQFEPITLGDRVEDGVNLGEFSRIAPFLEVDQVADLPVTEGLLWYYDIFMRNPSNLIFDEIVAICEGRVEITDNTTEIL